MKCYCHLVKKNMQKKKKINSTWWILFKVEVFSYEMNKFWGSNVQHGD